MGQRSPCPSVHRGDMCPVCGQKIEVLSKDEDFQSMLALSAVAGSKRERIQGKRNKH